MFIQPISNKAEGIQTTSWIDLKNTVWNQINLTKNPQDLKHLKVQVVCLKLGWGSLFDYIPSGP